jgi:hypothetical protein
VIATSTPIVQGWFLVAEVGVIAIAALLRILGARRV